MLLALTPEELGLKMLFLLKGKRGTFHIGNMQKDLWGQSNPNAPQYPRQQAREINLAVAEAWAWLHTEGLVVEDPDNGQYGWHQLSRRALRMETGADFTSFKVAR